jgi:hypothetical protein
MANSKTAETSAAPQVGAETSTPDDDSIVLKELTLEVRKSLTSTVVTHVYEHELPVLNAAYGRDRLGLIEVQEVSVKGFDPEAEFARLARKYPGKGKMNLLKEAYPLGVRSLEELVGVASRRRHQERPDAFVAVRPGATEREAA